MQPFDGNKFNFTKVGQEEVIFQFEASENDEIQFFPNAPVDADNSPSVVAINVRLSLPVPSIFQAAFNFICLILFNTIILQVSPIEYGHVLLIPRVLECLPQRIDQESLLLALYMAAEAGSPYFRLGYNSLGAFATINHLHFQVLILALKLLHIINWWRGIHL